MFPFLGRIRQHMMPDGEGAIQVRIGQCQSPIRCGAANRTVTLLERGLVERPVGRGVPTQAISNERRQPFGRRVAPADAERVARRVGVHLVTLLSMQIGRRLEKAGPERHYLFVRRLRVADVEVEMHLLGSPVRPVRRDVARRQLDPDPPLSGSIDDGVPRFVLEHVPTEYPGPERALGMQISGIEHDDLANHFHAMDAIDRIERAYRRSGQGKGGASPSVRRRR
jgi:hypothetical protein